MKFRGNGTPAHVQYMVRCNNCHNSIIDIYMNKDTHFTLGTHHDPVDADVMGAGYICALESS